MTFEVDGGEIDIDSVRDWVSGLLRSVENFRFATLNMNLEPLEAAEASEFLKSTSLALHRNTDFDGLSDVCLQLFYPALEVLGEEHFLQWPYMQNLKRIYLEMVRLL